MKFGYIRVSTEEQNIERQLNELLKYNINKKNIFIDKKSGRNLNRDEYQKLKYKLREGDEIYFHELDRLGRNKKQVKDELEYFYKNGVTVRILDVPTTMMNFDEFGDMQRSILDMVNNLLIEVLSTLAETELIRNQKRQREGIEIAKKEGKYSVCGRPKKNIPKNFEVLYKQHLEGKLTITDMATLLNYKSRSSIYAMIDKYNNEFIK